MAIQPVKLRLHTSRVLEGVRLPAGIYDGVEITRPSVNHPNGILTTYEMLIMLEPELGADVTPLFESGEVTVVG